jgi:dephospho-CoA kinase
MKLNKNIKIITLVGMTGSGKSTVVDYLKANGLPDVYFGGMVYKEMRRRGIAITPTSEKTFREQIRQTEGKDWVASQVITEAHRLITAGQRRLLFDGLYSWSEYKTIKHEFPGEVAVVAVVAPKVLRHHRLAHRPERPLTEQEANQRDWSEIENLEKGGPIAAADYYLDNTGDKANLYQQVDDLLKDLKFLD